MFKSQSCKVVSQNRSDFDSQAQVHPSHVNRFSLIVIILWTSCRLKRLESWLLIDPQEINTFARSFYLLASLMLDLLTGGLFLMSTSWLDCTMLLWNQNLQNNYRVHKYSASKKDFTLSSIKPVWPVHSHTQMHAQVLLYCFDYLQKGTWVQLYTEYTNLRYFEYNYLNHQVHIIPMSERQSKARRLTDLRFVSVAHTPTHIGLPRVPNIFIICKPFA